MPEGVTPGIVLGIAALTLVLWGGAKVVKKTDQHVVKPIVHHVIKPVVHVFHRHRKHV